MRVSREFRRPLVFILIIACCIGLFLVIIPPSSIWSILGFLFLLGFLLYGISRIWLRKRYAVLFSLFVSSLLLLKAIGLFDTINVILLVSLFVGIFLLIK